MDRLAVPKNQIQVLLQKPKPDLFHSGPLCCTKGKHPLPTKDVTLIPQMYTKLEVKTNAMYEECVCRVTKVSKKCRFIQN